MNLDATGALSDSDEGSAESDGCMNEELGVHLDEMGYETGH